MPAPSVHAGRLLIATAACLWSLNGLFMKLLTQPNALRLGEPPMGTFTIAAGRAFFAGLVMVPLIPWKCIRWQPAMGAMVLCFGTLNLLFVWALGRGTAANALILQYTAPLWLVLAGLAGMGEKPNRQDITTLVLAMIGLFVIIGDALLRPSWEEAFTVALGVGSGVAFAAVVYWLRVLRDEPGAWLTAQNFLVGSLVALPLALREALPTWPQGITLVLFGAVQLGFPYLLMTKGLKSVSGPEAAMICLLEPLLSPVWAYMVSGEVPARATLLGGGLILTALAYRYYPTRPAQKSAAA